MDSNAKGKNDLPDSWTWERFKVVVATPPPGGATYIMKQERALCNPAGDPPSPGPEYKQDGGKAGKGEWYLRNKGVSLEDCMATCNALTAWGCQAISHGAAE